MSERIGESSWPWLAQETINRTKLAEVFSAGGFRAAGEYFLDAANIKINYRRKELPNFAEWRRQLNSKAGLVICNHPGYVEIPAILQTLERRDVKIMINKILYNGFSQQFGEQYFVPSARAPREFVAVSNQIIDHIQTGGIFLMFPTGGERLTDYNDNYYPQFMGGFRTILSRLSPNNMVYSFFVNPEQSYRLRRVKVPTFLGLASEVLTKGEININKTRAQSVVDVDEHYSEVDFWQDILKQSADKHEQDKLLTKAYFNQFRKEYPDYPD